MAATGAKHNERLLFAAFAACCVVPMLAIVVLSTVLGVAIGPAAAISIGVVAAITCATLMVSRHRNHRHEADTP